MYIHIIYMFFLTARKPAQRFCIFFFVLDYFGMGVVGWGGGVGLLTSLVFFLHDLRSDNLFYFVAHTSCIDSSCYVDYHGVGGWGGVINVLGLRPSRPSLRWICLLCVLAHASWYVGYVFSASLHTLHGTLDTSCLLPCTHFMLRWIRLLWFLCFVAHTSCYVASSQPKRWASWHEGKPTAGAAVWSHTFEHDDCENVTILYRKSIGIYDKCVFCCSGR